MKWPMGSKEICLTPDNSLMTEMETWTKHYVAHRHNSKMQQSPTHLKRWDQHCYRYLKASVWVYFVKSSVVQPRRRKSPVDTLKCWFRWEERWPIDEGQHSRKVHANLSSLATLTQTHFLISFLIGHIQLVILYTHCFKGHWTLWQCQSRVVW